MHIGLSWRALVHFLILELLMVGLLALIGQVPWWLWFVASGLLFAAMWAYDHKFQLSVLVRRAAPARLVAVALGGIALCILSTALLTLAWVDLKKLAPESRGPLPPQQQAPPSPQQPSAASSFDQSLLAIIAVATEKKHDPIRLGISLINAGRLPTSKAFVSMEMIISDTDLSRTNKIEQRFADRAVRASRQSLGELTLAPGQLLNLSLWSADVTKDVYEDFMAGQKFIYVLLAADYTDRTTPAGKRMIMEFAIRPSTSASGVEDPMKNWSLVRNRSYMYE